MVSSAWMRSAAKTWVADHIDQRHQGCRGCAHPVGQRRDIEVDAFAFIDVALAIERQVQAVLGEQDMGEQLGACAPARDRMRGRRRLGDRFAGPAGELLAHVLDHLPLPRNELQRLGHVLADLAQPAVAAAWAGRRRRIDDALARQMRGQRTARRLAPLERWHRDLLGCRQLRRGLGLRRILFQVGKLQLKLIEQRATLRGLSELLVPQLLDRELELLDQQCPRLGFGFRRQAGRSLGAQHRLQRDHIVGERIVGAHRPKRITIRRSLSGLTIVLSIQIAAISRPLVGATYVAASASRCLPAGSQAGPA